MSSSGWARTSSVMPPALIPSMPFEQACQAVVGYLTQALPLRYWSISRFDGTDQVYLCVQDTAYGSTEGDSHTWDSSLCKRMIEDGQPQIAPDVSLVPSYAGATVTTALGIGAYVGIPIRRSDGELFGTVCGLDPSAQPAQLLEHRALLELLAALLSSVLDADLERVASRRESERLQAAAESDALTGAYNRRGWQRLLEAEEGRVRAFGAPGSVIVLDLDGLKEVNDRFGHAEGDRYLQTAAECLRGGVRDTDVVARLGGDEFAVLAPEATDGLTRELVERLGERLRLRGVGASFGWAQYTRKRGLSAAWAEADEAMYAQKRRRHRDVPIVLDRRPAADPVI